MTPCIRARQKAGSSSSTSADDSTSSSSGAARSGAHGASCGSRPCQSLPERPSAFAGAARLPMDLEQASAAASGTGGRGWRRRTARSCTVRISRRSADCSRSSSARRDLPMPGSPIQLDEGAEARAEPARPNRLSRRARARGRRRELARWHAVRVARDEGPERRGANRCALALDGERLERRRPRTAPSSARGPAPARRVSRPAPARAISRAASAAVSPSTVYVRRKGAPPGRRRRGPGWHRPRTGKSRVGIDDSAEASKAAAPRRPPPGSAAPPATRMMRPPSRSMLLSRNVTPCRSEQPPGRRGRARRGPRPPRLAPARRSARPCPRSRRKPDRPAWRCSPSSGPSVSPSARTRRRDRPSVRSRPPRSGRLETDRPCWPRPHGGARPPSFGSPSEPVRRALRGGLGAEQDVACLGCGLHLDRRLARARRRGAPVRVADEEEVERAVWRPRASAAERAGGVRGRPIPRSVRRISRAERAARPAWSSPS